MLCLNAVLYALAVMSPKPKEDEEMATRKVVAFRSRSHGDSLRGSKCICGGGVNSKLSNASITMMTPCTGLLHISMRRLQPAEKSFMEEDVRREADALPRVCRLPKEPRRALQPCRAATPGRKRRCIRLGLFSEF